MEAAISLPLQIVGCAALHSTAVEGMGVGDAGRVRELNSR